MVPHVLAAGFGLDGEARRHRQSGIGHLGQSGAFAAEFVLHLAVTFGVSVAEKVDVLHGLRVGGCCGFNFGVGVLMRSPLLIESLSSLKGLGLFYDVYQGSRPGLNSISPLRGWIPQVNSAGTANI